MIIACPRQPLPLLRLLILFILSLSLSQSLHASLSFSSSFKNVREQPHHKKTFIVKSDNIPITITTAQPPLCPALITIITHFPRGGGRYFIPAGYNPFGYALTELGKDYLTFDGSLDSDVGRFLASFKSGRKSKTTLKAQWLEVVRMSKKGQSSRIYRKLDDLIAFCLKAGFLD